MRPLKIGNMHRSLFRSTLALTVCAVFAAWAPVAAQSSLDTPAPSADPLPAPSASPLASMNEPSGSAYVTSLPSNADLWIDGVHIGRTPLLVGALYRGRHTLTLAKSGWATQDIAFRVVPNTVALQNHYLSRVKDAGPGRPGSALLHAPAGAKLKIDGVLVADPAAPQTLRAGRHSVQVIQATATFARDFQVVPEMTTDLVLRDAPAAHAPSVVAAVTSLIPSSAITIEHTKIIVRYRGHIAVGHLGDSAMRVDAQSLRIDPAPVMLDGALYLPIDVINMLTGPEREL